MQRLPGPYKPFGDMSLFEQRQYLDCRLWHSSKLQVCFVCETELGIVPYQGGFICGPCRIELESVGEAQSVSFLGVGF